MSVTLLCGHDYVKHPVIYLHMKPSPGERNMSASQKEWLATIRALDKLRSCVFSQKKFTLWTNHPTLTWLRAECNRNGNTRSDSLGSFCFSKWTFNMFLVGKECLRGKKTQKGRGVGGAEKGQKVSTNSNHQPAKNKGTLYSFIWTLWTSKREDVRGTGLSWLFRVCFYWGAAHVNWEVSKRTKAGTLGGKPKWQEAVGFLNADQRRQVTMIW